MTSPTLLSPIGKYVRAFLLKRTPKADHISFSLKNIYVFFSAQGLLFGLLLIITFVMGINYANNLVLGLCFYLFGMWLVGVFYTFVQLSALELTLIEISLTEAQKDAWVSVQIANKSGKSSRQIVLGFDGGEPVIVPYVDKTMTVRLSVPTHQRGRMALPRLTIHTVYPLGILKAWAYAYFDSPVYVYPKPQKFDWQTTLHAMHGDGEQTGLVGKIGQDEFERLDEYQAGESLARVSWGHLARGAGMLTKHFADPVGIQTKVDYQQMPSIHHEQKLSEMAFAIKALQDSELGFFVVLPSWKSEFGSGQAFVQSCLLALAKEP